MGKGKQSLRKGYDGSTPVFQSACTSSAQMRTYITSQQAQGSSQRNQKKIFVNYENTFSSFGFSRSNVNVDFQPAVQLGYVRNYTDKAHDPAMFMRVDFLSRYDGRADLLAASRPSMDVIFVVDVSGSMNSAFPGDVDRRSKIDVAKDCLKLILSKFSERDRVGIVLFDTATQLLTPLSFLSPDNRKKIIDDLKSVRGGGGTNLGLGLSDGFERLLGDPIEDQESRLQRVYFLTDMQSTPTDEVEVIQIAVNRAKGHRRSFGLNSGQRREPLRTGADVLAVDANLPRCQPAYFSLVGIAVDLSMDSVERICSIPGAKYISATSASELQANVVDDFDFDVMPIAFDVTCELPVSFGAFQQSYGSSELSGLTAGSQSFTISAEFAVPLTRDNQGMGSLYLFKLQPPSFSTSEGKTGTSTFPPADTEHLVQFRWVDRAGEIQQAGVNVTMPALNFSSPQDNASVGCDLGIRKAVALTRYVDTLTAYATAGNEGDQQLDDYDDYDGYNNRGVHSARVQFNNLRNTRRNLASARIMTPQQRTRTQQRRSFSNMFQSQSVRSKPASQQQPSRVIIPQAQTVAASVTATSADAVTDDWTVDRVLSLSSPDLLPADWVSRVRTHASNMIQFNQLLQYLQSEMAICGDTSFSTTNQNIPQTIQQIVDLEGKDFERALHPAAQRIAFGIAETQYDGEEAEEEEVGMSPQIHRRIQNHLNQQELLEQEIDDVFDKGEVLQDSQQLQQQQQQQQRPNRRSSRRGSSCIVS
jgi:Mg-chelatase subunit ChlD